MHKILGAAVFSLVAMTSSAVADAGIKIGVLTCRVEGGAGFLIGSSKNIDCKFKPAGGGRAERYTGSIGKLGLDIGITNDTIVGWLVFAPGKMKAGALKGSYTGVSAEATAGLGLGANALIGGFRQAVNLQPLSVQAQTGLNIAVAITSLTLRYDR
jgi:hypothetical protein